MMANIDRITLYTADYATGLDLPVGPYRTNFTQNPEPRYYRQTDWSGGLYMKIFPREDKSTNMAWGGSCWTINGNEARPGPLRTVVGTRTEPILYLTEFSQNNKLYWAEGAKKYEMTTAGASIAEVDSGGSATVTDIQEVDGKLRICLGTATVAREFDGTSWTAGEKYQTIAWADQKPYWASNPTSGGVACFLYWGTAAADRVQVGLANRPITRIIEALGELIIFKSNAMYLWQPGPKKALRLQHFAPDGSGGKWATEYNDALYFNFGETLWVWRGEGAATAVPTPAKLIEGQVDKVYSICNIDRALLVGFQGGAYILVEDPPRKGQYWWHYLSSLSGSKYRNLLYTSTGLSRPRIYLGFNTAATSTMQYLEFVAEIFRPYEFETGTSIIFPGMYTGSDLYPMWLQSIICGTRNCTANRTIQWAYSTNPFDDSPTWTDIGSAITANGFQTVTPTGNVSGNIIWLRATFVTNSTTAGPVLDFWRAKYFARAPSQRVWYFPVLALAGGTMPGGGRQLAVGDMMTAVHNARDQTNPCTLDIPAQGVTGVQVWLDVQHTTQRADVRKGLSTREAFTLIATEVA